MGCCGSTPSDEDGQPSRTPQVVTQQTNAPPITPLPVNASPSSTSHDQPSQTPRISRSHSPSSSSTPLRPSSPSGRDRPNLPSHERYNTPLVLPSPWTSTTRNWTFPQLQREREDFFDTRVTGRAENWAALQNVSELVRNGDVATAQGILDAAGITLPTGNLCDGCYDEAGNLYRLPEVILSDPVNIKKDGDSRNDNIDGDTIIGVVDTKASKSDDKGLQTGGSTTENTKEIMDSTPAAPVKAAPPLHAITVKCRLSDRGGPDVIITISKTEPISALAKMVQVEGKVSPALRIRFAYLGRVLKDSETLESQGWKEGHAVNAFVVGDVSA